MSITVPVRKPSGRKSGTVDLDEALFGIKPNLAVLHEVVTAQLAARRSGSHNTKTRAEARGGGRKPWRQKGTGRARQGSIRSPQFTGGGVAHGPKPRSYAKKVNRKTVRLALCSALSDRAASERVMVVDAWAFKKPCTKDALSALEGLKVDGEVLLVLSDTDADDTAARSFRNLPNVNRCSTAELNAYDILRSDWLVFTIDTLPTADAEQLAEPGEAPETDEAPEPEAEPVVDEAPEEAAS